SLCAGDDFAWLRPRRTHVLPCFTRRGVWVLGATPPGAPRRSATTQNAQSHRGIADGPQPALLVQSQVRFEQDRINKQGKQTAEIARAVEEIRVARRGLPGLGKPCLQERPAAGDYKAPQTDDHDKGAT